MEIRKPIFIIGAGRSGTTELYNILALHNDVCWFSGFTNAYPDVPWSSVLNRSVHAPIVGRFLRHRILKRISPSLRPSEGELLFRDVCGFNDDRKMSVGDLTPRMEEKLKNLIQNHLRLTGRPRFLSKRTANTQRIAVIDAMFPDAYYIHIIRDGRAVANSLYNVSWWRDIEIWWLEGRADKWEQMGREPIELCAVHWMRNVQEILDHRQLFGDRYLEVRYEELVQDPIDVIRKILAFCELGEYPKFFEAWPDDLRNMNYKWSKNLSASQRQAIERSVYDFMLNLGYQME